MRHNKKRPGHFARAFLVRFVNRCWTARRLESELQTELDSPGASRSDQRIARHNVWRGASAAERALLRSGVVAYTPTGNRSVGVSILWAVENVKEFHAELGAIAFLEFEILKHREVHVMEPCIAEGVP